MTTRNKIFTSVIATFAVMYGGDVCAAPMVSPDSSSSAKPIMQLTSRDYVDGLVAPVKKMVEDHDTLLGHVIMTTTVDTVTGAINELNRTKLNIEGHEASRIVVTNELGAITTATAVEMTQVNGLTTELNSKQIKLTSENLKGSGSVDIAFDENGVITVNGGEGISYTSGDTYVSVDNTTEKISVNADTNVRVGSGLATSTAVIAYALPKPVDCIETTCVLSVDGNGEPYWMKLELIYELPNAASETPASDTGETTL